VVQLLDILHSEQNFLKALFPETPEATLDLDNIHIMGHSFGGATALYSACNDKRITGHAILIDPWFYPIPDDLDLRNLKKSFLCLKSSNFVKIFPDWKNDDFMKAVFSSPKQKEILKKSFICVLENSGHNSLTDMAFILPVENKMTGLIINTDRSSLFEIYDTSRLLITQFLKESDLENFKNKTVLPEKYRKIITPVIY